VYDVWKQVEKRILSCVVASANEFYFLLKMFPTKLFSDKPTTPTIVFSKYPFVGDEIEFTCTSQVQRWPVEFSLSLTYTFSIDGAKQHNTLKFNVTISDKEKKVSCTAMDDRRDMSNVSNVIVKMCLSKKMSTQNFMSLFTSSQVEN
jgi:hypothetical protein